MTKISDKLCGISSDLSEIQRELDIFDKNLIRMGLVDGHPPKPTKFVLYINGEEAPYPIYNRRMWKKIREFIWIESILALLMIFFDFFNDRLSKKGQCMPNDRYFGAAFWIGAINLGMTGIRCAGYRNLAENEYFRSIKCLFGVLCGVSDFVAIGFSLYYTQIVLGVNLERMNVTTETIDWAKRLIAVEWMLIVVEIAHCLSTIISTYFVHCCCDRVKDHWVYIYPYKFFAADDKEHYLEPIESCDICCAQKFDIPEGSFVQHYVM